MVEFDVSHLAVRLREPDRQRHQAERSVRHTEDPSLDGPPCIMGRILCQGDTAMPKMELMSIDEAMMKTATGRRAKVLQEYLGYIGQLKAGQAGKLEPDEGETAAAVRRRIGAAAKALGKEVVIKGVGEEVYFWVQPTRRRRGRRGSGQTAAE